MGQLKVQKNMCFFTSYYSLVITNNTMRVVDGIAKKYILELFQSPLCMQQYLQIMSRHCAPRDHRLALT